MSLLQRSLNIGPQIFYRNTWRPLRSRLDPPDLLPGQTLPIFFFFSSLPTQASSTLGGDREIRIEIKIDDIQRVPVDKLLVHVEVTIFTFVALRTHTPDDPLTMVAVGHLGG